MKKQVNNNFVNIFLMVLVVGVIAGLFLSGAYRYTVQVLDPAQRQTLLTEQAAMMPIRIITRIVWRVGLVAGVGYGAYRVFIIGLNWLDLRSRQIHAKNGLYPVIKTNMGLYDPNRSIGEHPAITLQALQVQKQAALTAEKVNVSVKDNSATLPALSVGTEDLNNSLPDVLPVSQMGQQFSLDKLTIGQGEQGLIAESLYNLMHLLCVGSSGWGKSSLLRYLLFQLAQCPEAFDVLAVDINGSEFNLIQQWDRLLFPVARDAGQAIALLQAFSEETARRKALYEAVPMAYDLPSYNQLVSEPLKPQILLIDEGTNLLNQSGIGEPLREAAQTSRQYGQYIMMTGQSAKASVLDSQTRDNFTSRLCFHTSKPSYRVVLDETVDVINTKGRCWTQLPGRELTQVQVPFVSKQQLLGVLTTGTPSNPMPEVIDISTEVKIIEDDDTLDNEGRIKHLHAQGVSLRQIQQRIFGYTGGSAYSAVKDALNGSSTAKNSVF